MKFLENSGRLTHLVLFLANRRFWARSENLTNHSPPTPRGGNMFDYHIITCISLADMGNHIRTYLDMVKIDSSGKYSMVFVVNKPFWVKSIFFIFYFLPTLWGGNMFEYHILTCISLGDIGNHIWTYPSASKIDQTRLLTSLRCPKRHLFVSDRGRGPKQKKRKKGNDTTRCPQYNSRVWALKLFSSFFYN